MNTTQKFELPESAVSLLRELETSFLCNGICDYGNFYFFINVAEGPPKKTCQDKVVIIFDNVTLNVGIIIGVTFVLLLVVFSMQYWICYTAGKG
jgi:hypothetical protein